MANKLYPLGSRKMKFINKELYAIGDFGAGYIDTFVNTFFLFFMTDVILMDAVQAGLITAVSKAWDAISDPLMGYISDRTKSKRGRRNFWLWVAWLPGGAAVFLLFNAVTFADANITWAYYLIMFLLHSTFWTMLNVPYNCLPNEMTTSYEDRATIQGMRAWHSRPAALMCAYLVPAILYSGSFSMVDGFRISALIGAAIYSFCWLLVYFGTWNYPVSDEEYAELAKDTGVLNVFTEWLSVYKNKAMRATVFFMLSGYVAVYIYACYIMYYIVTVMDMASVASLLTLPTTLGCAIIAIFCGKIIYKMGNGPAYILSGLMFGGGLCVATFNITSFAWTWVWMFIAGLGMCGIMLAPYNTVPYAIDVDYVITKKHTRGGTYMGMVTFSQKVAQAIVVAILGAIITYAGYNGANDVQPESAYLTILYIMRWGSLIALIPGFICAAMYPITPDAHAKFLKACDKLEAGATVNELTDEEKKICVDFSGWDLECLYKPGNNKLTAPVHKKK